LRVHIFWFALKGALVYGGRYVYISPIPPVRHMRREEKHFAALRPPEQPVALA
jgi:hypothetical protein